DISCYCPILLFCMAIVYVLLYLRFDFLFFFFFQAEDGIRDKLVTGVQTCALPISDDGFPVAATLLGKSVIGEQHPFYLGIYEGAMGRENVRQYVESSDCVILMGAFMTDINLGVYTARLDPGRCIYATSEKLSIRYHTYEE